MKKKPMKKEVTMKLAEKGTIVQGNITKNKMFELTASDTS
jgi:hypothetical protein